MDQAPTNRLPLRIFLICIAVVAGSTFGLPSVTGYGTKLFQLVVLGALAWVAEATSGTFADQHHMVVWCLAGLLNTIAFSIPALIAYFVFRRRAPIFISFVLIAWFLFYIGCLFILFPATDGP